jgi:RNA polymerase sigma-70 factor (ECF subfamily)
MLASFENAAPKVDRTTPESEAANREELALFATALGRLGTRKREAFMLVELEGLSAEEVGETLDVSAATIRTRLFYARAELRAAMDKR